MTLVDSPAVTDPADDALIELALAVRANAYAPYSRFQVGAVLRATSGRI